MSECSPSPSPPPPPPPPPDDNDNDNDDGSWDGAAVEEDCVHDCISVSLSVHGAPDLPEWLVEQLMEDCEFRAFVFATMLRAGLEQPLVQQLWQQMGRRLVVDHPTVVPDAVRNQHIAAFGWTRFLAPEVQHIVQLHRSGRVGALLELGAGSGWLAYLLAQQHVPVFAYDSHHPQTYMSQWERMPWAHLVQHCQSLHDALRAHAVTDAADAADAAAPLTLLLCWPDLDSGFAAECLEHFAGSHLLYVGEPAGGCCANAEFFRILADHWEVLSEFPKEPFRKVADSIVLHRRRSPRVLQP